jgi:hypothetical protein
MATKQQRIQNQNTLISVHAAATAQLMQIQGVEDVAVGLKEVNGLPTDQICFRVYVQKLQANPVGNVPAVVQGFPTEVVQIFAATDGPNENPSFAETERKDETEHRPLKGGIAVSSKSVTEKEHSSGTLGWFAKTVPGNSTVLLTCAHVLWPDLFDGMPAFKNEDADKVAQPIYEKTCCCEYHVMGRRIIGIKNGDVDCAIAGLLDEFVPPALIIGNRSTDVTLRVDGKDIAAIGDKVRKIGKRSGYTEGIVIDVGSFPAGTMISVPTIPGGTKHALVKTRVHQILIWPTTRQGFTPYFDDHAYQMAFSNAGDSGSVVIDENHNIVGTIYSGDDLSAKRAVGIANNIDIVLKALKDNGHEIELLKSPPGGGNRGIAADFRLPRARTLNDLVRESDTLVAALVRRHRDEVARLIDHCRPVTVAWHRHHGPAFAAAVNRSQRERAYRIPSEINGIGRHELFVAMARALEQHGSAVLQEDLREHGLALIDDLCQTDNIRAILFPAVEAMPVAQPV